MYSVHGRKELGVGNKIAIFRKFIDIYTKLTQETDEKTHKQITIWNGCKSVEDCVN